MIIFAHDVTNKILSRDPNYIVDAVIWPKLGNSSFSMTEVIITSVLYGLDPKYRSILRGGLGSSSNLTFYTSMAKGLKLEIRKF